VWFSVGQIRVFIAYFIGFFFTINVATISVKNTVGFNSGTSSCKADQAEFLISSCVAWIMARILIG